MKDIASILKDYERRGQDLVRRNCIPSATLTDISKAFLGLLPESARGLQELSRYFEAEMLRCRDAGAYFSGCLAGAAMIESFLLHFCVLERTMVERSHFFRRLNKKKKDYAGVISMWTLKELIPLAEELEWIGPKVVDRELVSALVEGYGEMLPASRPDLKDEDLRAILKSLENRPDVALLVLIQSMRNLVHGGRCVRLKKQLGSPDFVDWTKLVMVLIVETRDCLILRMGAGCRRYLTDLADSPEGLIALADVYGRFFRGTRA